MPCLEKLHQKCEKCGKAFISPSRLKTHFKIHEKNQIQECPFCSKKIQLSKIDSHIENVHPDPEDLLLDKTTIQNQIMCNICKISFYIKSDLIKHKKKGHRSLNKEPSRENKRDILKSKPTQELRRSKRNQKAKEDKDIEVENISIERKLVTQKEEKILDKKEDVIASTENVSIKSKNCSIQGTNSKQLLEKSINKKEVIITEKEKNTNIKNSKTESEENISIEEENSSTSEETIMSTKKNTNIKPTTKDTAGTHEELSFTKESIPLLEKSVMIAKADFSELIENDSAAPEIIKEENSLIKENSSMLKADTKIIKRNFSSIDENINSFEEKIPAFKKIASMPQENNQMIENNSLITENPNQIVEDDSKQIGNNNQMIWDNSSVTKSRISMSEKSISSQNQCIPYLEENVELPSENIEIAEELSQNPFINFRKIVKMEKKYQIKEEINLTPEECAKFINIKEKINSISKSNAKIKRETVENTDTPEAPIQILHENNKFRMEEISDTKGNAQIKMETSLSSEEHMQVLNGCEISVNDKCVQSLNENNEKVVNTSIIDENTKIKEENILLTKENELILMKNIPVDEESSDAGNKYQCKFCKKLLESKNTLDIHERTHKEKLHGCSFCDKKFSAKESAVVHETKYHFSCYVCSNSFNSKIELDTHKKIHKGEKIYNCSYCDKKFTATYSIMLHERIHTGEKPYSCGYCNEKFRQKTTLKKHERIHTGEKSYNCSYCEKKFTNKDGKLIHERYHTGEKPYSCSFCNKSFFLKNTAKNHILEHDSANTITVKFSCKKYPTDSREKEQFIHEKTSKEQLKSESNLPNISNLKRKKLQKDKIVFSCKICQKSFEKNISLVQHKKTHRKSSEKIPFRRKKELKNKKNAKYSGKKYHKHLLDPKHTDKQKKLIHNETLDQEFSNNSSQMTRDKPQKNEMSVDKKNSFSCKVCQRSFHRKDSFIKHERVHSGEKPYSCIYCQRKFTQKGHVKAHEMTHTGKKIYSCKYCERKFTQKCNVKTHEMTHTGVKPYSCCFCDKKFIQKLNCKKHEKFCNIKSQEEISKKTEIIGHNISSSNKRLQNNPLINKCDENQGDLNEKSSNNEFANDSSSCVTNKQKKDEVLEYQEQFSCNTCQKRFDRKDYLVKHEKIHTGDKPHKCSFCDMRFDVDAKAKRHERSCKMKIKDHLPKKKESKTKDHSVYKQISNHDLQSSTTVKEHNDVREDMSKEASNPEFQNDFLSCNTETTMKNEIQRTKANNLCKICQKIFSGKENLAIHERTHTGERPYTCNHCDKRFFRKDTAKIHERTHTGEKPYSCGFCDKKFSHKATANEHQRTHTGEKPYSCNMCNKRFSQSSANKHKKRCSKRLKQHLIKKEHIEIQEDRIKDKNLTQEFQSTEISPKNILPNEESTEVSREGNLGEGKIHPVPNKSSSMTKQRTSKSKRNASVAKANDLVEENNTSEEKGSILKSKKNSPAIEEHKSLAKENSLISEENNSEEKACTLMTEKNSSKVEENKSLTKENISITKGESISVEEEIMNEIILESFFECEFCEEKFDDDKIYRQNHLPEHLKPWKKGRSNCIENSNICELCGAGFSKNTNIKIDHMKTFHKVTKNLKKHQECLVCFLESEPLALFYSNEGMRIHIKHKHETEKWKFCCNRCDSRFINGTGLEAHVKSFHRITNPSKVSKLRKLKDGNFLLVDKIENS